MFDGGHEGYVAVQLSGWEDPGARISTETGNVVSGEGWVNRSFCSGCPELSRGKKTGGLGVNVDGTDEGMSSSIYSKGEGGGGGS